MSCLDLSLILGLVQELDFPRVVGTVGEERGFRIIWQWLSAMGVEPRFERFESPWIEIDRAAVSVEDEQIAVEPIVSPVWNNPWLFVPAFLSVKGVLVAEDQPNSGTAECPIVVRTTCDSGKPVIEGAAAQLFACDPVEEFVAYLLACTTDCPSAYVSEQQIPWMQQHLGQAGTLTWSSRRFQRELANLTVEVRGRTTPEGIVVAGAHLDSFPGTVGASDDATGCAVLVEIARWFSQHRPERTLRLVWFTGEELDRRGSQAYVAQHADEIPAMKFYLNVDGGFSVVHGPPIAVGVTGGESVRTAVAEVVRESISPEHVRLRPPGASDSAAFAEVGVPTAHVHASRQTPPPYPHLPADRPENIDANQVRVISGVALSLLEGALHSAIPSGA